MSTKQDTQFSLENCSCMEMMSQMMSQSKDQQGVGSACAEMMSQFAEPQGGGSEFLEKMSQMMDSCCGMRQEDDGENMSQRSPMFGFRWPGCV